MTKSEDCMEIRYDFEYLIHLLYCAIHDVQPQEKPAHISFENVFELGKMHEVGNIAFLSVDRLREKPEPALYNEWQVFYFHSVQRNARQLAEYGAITKLLTENDIRWTEAQGTVTKTIYPHPEWRMMSDMDFLIDEENIPKVREIMTALGHEVHYKENENEVNVYPEKGTAIEFHHDFFTEFYEGSFERYSGAMNSPFLHAVPDEENSHKWILDTTYYYMYTLLHTIKHYEYAGCGIRRILDLYYLRKTLSDKVDHDLLEAAFEKYHFTALRDTLFALEEFWFEDKPADFDLTETAIDIVRSGNHGTADFFLRNSLRRDADDSMQKAKLRRMKRFLFPSLEELYEGHPAYKEKGYSLLKCRVLRAAEHFRPSEIKKMLHFFKRIKNS
ncbi:MAG: hypothetical protein E7520_02405 [Ruminococcaceae bacterium]|nr:hypothetical protein [Oscillospiraceae bacterium]